MENACAEIANAIGKAQLECGIDYQPDAIRSIQKLNDCFDKYFNEKLWLRFLIVVIMDVTTVSMIS